MLMKKLIAWILMLCMVMGLLCGCSDTDSSSDRRSDREDRDEEEVEDRVDDEDRDDEDEEIEEDDEPVEMNVVIYDENNIKLTVTGLSNGCYAKEVGVRLENNTDSDIRLSVGVFEVNGITIDAARFVSAYAGETVDDVIKLDYDDLELAGIRKIATVSCMDAYIYDSDSLTTVANIPFSFEIPSTEGYVQTIDDSGEVLFQKDGITVICRKIYDEEDGDNIVLVVKNDMSQYVHIQITNMTENALVSYGMGSEIWPESLRFYAPEITPIGTEDKVEELSFMVQILDPDSMMPILDDVELTVRLG